MHKFSKISTFTMFALLTVGGAAGCSNPRGDYAFKMMSAFGQTYSAFLQKLIDYEWETNGLNIELENISGYENLQKAINESIPNLQYPTIANGYPDHFAGYILSGIQVPLNDYIDAYDAEHGTHLMEDYYRDYMYENESLLTLPDGRKGIMGLPFNKSTELLGYNGYFVDYAIQEGKITKVPESWQEWAVYGPELRKLQIDMCGKYLHGDIDAAHNASNMVLSTEAAVSGKTLLLDMSKVTPETSRLMSWDATDNMFITIVRQWGGVYTSYNDRTMKGYAEFNNVAVQTDSGTVNSREKTIAALTFFNGLFGSASDPKTQVFGLPANFGDTYSSTAFKNNKVMFTVCSSGGLIYNTSADEEESNQRFKMAPIPYFDAGEEVHKYVISQGTNLALFDQGDEETLQKAFNTMVDFTTGKIQAGWAIDTGYFPGAKSAAEDPDYKAMLESEVYENWVQVAYRESSQVNENEYMNATKGWTKFVDPGFNGSSKIRSTVKSIMASVFNYVSTGEKTYQDVLDEAYNELSGLTH